MATFYPRDFIYAGQRVASTKKEAYACIYPVKEDGSLADQMLFPMKVLPRGIVGGIYRGAEFDETYETIRGAKRVEFSGRWQDRQAIIQWEAEQYAAKEIMARRKLEKEEAVTEIERIMLPLRERYAAASRRFSGADCAALERAVLQALRIPPRNKEITR